MKVRILILLAAAMLSVSCSVSRMAVSSPDRTQLNVTMDDLEYLGESEISVEYRTYLGFINKVDVINGVPFDRQETKTLVMSSKSSSFVDFPAILDQAAYKLSEEYPEADYFRVVSTKVQKDILFLGGHKVVTARVKAYKLLSINEKNSDCAACPVIRGGVL